LINREGTPPTSSEAPSTTFGYSPEQGKLPALRVGRRVRIRRSDFERLLQEGFTGGARDAPSQQREPTAEDFWSGEAVGNVQAPPDQQEQTDQPEDQA
jgi:hypothetical protein